MKSRYPDEEVDDQLTPTQPLGVSTPYVSPTRGPESTYRTNVCSEGTMRREAVIHSAGGLKQEILIGPHRLMADEGPELGGQDAGPNPFNLLAAGLGA